jgi:8-oxo-dGTP diphosphatase
MTSADFAQERAWHTGLPGVVIFAAALIGDGRDGVLLVKPNYRDHWLLPGGGCEFAEPPHLACAREAAEELGVDVPIGPILAIDWLKAEADVYGPDARPSMYFLFDGGVLREPSRIVLQAAELDDCRFVPIGQIGEFLPTRAVLRVGAGIDARRDGRTRYIPLSVG